MAKKTLAVIMDPIASIHVETDTSLLLLLEAQKRGYQCHYLTLDMLLLRDKTVMGYAAPLTVKDKPGKHYTLGEPVEAPLHAFDRVLMRKDPPFDHAYLSATYLLDIAKQQGANIMNDPTGIRACNEKLVAQWFPACCPDTIVTSCKTAITKHLDKHKHLVLKPLYGMAGNGVFLLQLGDKNTSGIIDILTDHGKTFIMAQQYLPAIRKGDKRILMVHGKAAPQALARIPASTDFRGNVDAGASIKAVDLTARDQWLCEQVASTLLEYGLTFVGVDVIGDYITEINVTSPSCARELEDETGYNAASDFFDGL